MDFAGRAFGDGFERGQARQPPGEFVEPAHRANAVGRSDLACSRNAPGERRADDRATTRNINSASSSYGSAMVKVWTGGMKKKL